jgi:hypothetical protein
VAILAPSLSLLFKLTLSGRFDHAEPVIERSVTSGRSESGTHTRRVTASVGCLVAGSFLTILFDATWGLTLGIISLLAFIALAFPSLAGSPESGRGAR